MDVEYEDISGILERNIENPNGTEEKSNGGIQQNHALPICDNSVKKEVEEEASEYEKNKAEVTMTIGLQNESNKFENTSETSRSDHIYENGKRKIKEEKPPTKIVVRRLPPLMTKETFLEQISPIPPHDYMYFVGGDPSYGLNSYSRAYLNFINQEDVFTFTRTFDNYVFLDAKGQEYPAIVEFSPFQRVPKQRSKKKDTLTGTIESDPMYASFKENLLAEALENSKPGAKTMKQHYFETEISTTEEVSTTPLLEFLKQRRAEKARIRDERREEKKRKEAERKIKQKAKDKKVDGEDEETTKELKVFQSKDRREGGKDKDLKNTKKKEDKEKPLKENRTREFKNRSGKSYQEERIRQAERREERKKESTSASFERKSESQCSDSKETDPLEVVENVLHEEKNRSLIDKKKMYENKKKTETDDWKVEGDGDKRIKSDKNRGERRQRERERKRREEFASRKGFDKKCSENVDKKKKSFRSVTYDYLNDTKDTLSDSVKYTKPKVTAEEPREQPDRKISNVENDGYVICAGRSKIKDVFQRRKSFESCDIALDKLEDSRAPHSSKRRNSLESGNSVNIKCSLKSPSTDERNYSDTINVEPFTKNDKKEKSKEANDNCMKHSKFFTYVDLNIKKEQIQSPSNQIEHTKQETKHYNENNNSIDADSKSAETLNPTDSNNSSRSKDPRTDRRIRNKDRPSLQIYRPGMGKFSKQRLEKEKVLGSSTEVDSPSHSPSPTPKVKFPS